MSKNAAVAMQVVDVDAVEEPTSGTFVVAPSAEDVRTYMPLVHQIVARFMGKLPPNVLRDDLVAAGTYGLIDSLRKNGHDRGPTFEWYARIRIRGAILDELRTQDWLTRRARSRVTAASRGTEGQAASERRTVIGFDDLPVALSHIADETTRDPLEETMVRMERRALETAVAGLPDRERMIVTMHYFKGEQFKTIAEHLKVSEPRISQLHARAVSLLRRALTSESGPEAA
jgi:RNA polymerase sigma factor FliA